MRFDFHYGEGVHSVFEPIKWAPEISPHFPSVGELAPFDARVEKVYDHFAV